MTIQVTLRKIFAAFSFPASPKPCEGMGAPASRLRSFEIAHTTLMDEQPETVAELIERYAKG